MGEQNLEMPISGVRGQYGMRSGMRLRRKDHTCSRKHFAVDREEHGSAATDESREVLLGVDKVCELI